MRMQKSGYALAGLTAVFLMSSSLTPSSSALARDGNDGWPVVDCSNGCQELDQWASSIFGYCDAEALGKLWNISTYDAKIRIGQKLMLGNQSVVATELQRAFRRGGGCSGAFNYEDAGQVAELWSATTVG